MIVAKKSIIEKEEDKEWENPLNPEAPKDARDKEQTARLYEEANRQKTNLTEEDDNDKKN